jgi:hypothetical protein
LSTSIAKVYTIIKGAPEFDPLAQMFIDERMLQENDAVILRNIRYFRYRARIVSEPMQIVRLMDFTAEPNKREFLEQFETVYIVLEPNETDRIKEFEQLGFTLYHDELGYLVYIRRVIP